MTQPKSFPVRITYIGGPTALIEIGQLRFLTDPTFDKADSHYNNGVTQTTKKIESALTPDQLGRIDVVLLSHDHHVDNLDPVGRAYLPTAGRVLTTLSGAGRLGGNAQGLATWETITISGPEGLTVRITATPTRHGPPELAARMGEVNGWLLEWDGQQHGALYVSGDTVMFEDLQQIPQRYQVGTALLHLGAARFDVFGNAHLTFTAPEGAEFAQMLGAPTVVPLHYEGWAHYSEGRAQIEQAFTAVGLEDSLRFLPLGEAVVFDV